MKTAKPTTKLFAMVIALVTAVAIWSAWGATRAGCPGFRDNPVTDWDHLRADRASQRAQLRRRERLGHRLEVS